MSKSVGNVVAPQKVIDRFGAEVLRLWVAASDYKDDVRISDNILKQLSDAYRRIRNTCRFLLGNLADFDPASDAVAYEAMMELDQFTLHRLQQLIAKSCKAYDIYEFHTIYHALCNFCTVDLSAFYLDIIKDRLYTSPPKSDRRRSAQTVMYYLIDAIARIMAPILPFTSEEIWQFMPQDATREESIHLASLPEAKENWKNETLAAQWKTLLGIRGVVTKALEEARVKKLIGHSLNAAVTIFADEDRYVILDSYGDDLRDLFIVSKVSFKKADAAQPAPELEGLAVLVEAAPGDKCERCWVHDTSVGSNADHPTVCSRCLKALESIT